MAGFDYTTSCLPHQRGFIRNVLGSLQLEARHWSLSLRYRWEVDRYRVTIDGPLVRMQAFESYVVDVVPSLHCLHSHLPSRDRKRLCSRLVADHRSGMKAINESVAELALEVCGIPGSFHFSVRRASDLLGQLRILTNALSRYSRGLVSPSEIAETIHTTLEAVMHRAIGEGSRDMTYQQMALHLSSKLLIDAQVVAVLQLKDLRKRAKHQHRLVRPDEVEEVISQNLEAIHILTRRM